MRPRRRYSGSTIIGRPHPAGSADGHQPLVSYRDRMTVEIDLMPDQKCSIDQHRSEDEGSEQRGLSPVRPTLRARKQQPGGDYPHDYCDDRTCRAHREEKAQRVEQEAREDQAANAPAPPMKAAAARTLDEKAIELVPPRRNDGGAAMAAGDCTRGIDGRRTIRNWISHRRSRV